MRRIPLRARDGSVRAYALVDDGDYEWAAQWRWHLGSGGYVVRNEWLGGRCYTYRLHTALTGFIRVDHKDGDPLNNRRANLRDATQAQNNQNRRVNYDSRSGVRGVRRSGNRWEARAMVGGKNHYLGSHETLERAAEVVAAFRLEHMPYSEESRHGP